MAATAARRGLVFYYDIVCPYAYVGANQVVAAASSGVPVEWCPVVLGGLYKATAAPQGKDGSATDVMAPSKRAVTARDLVRRAERAGVPLSWNSRHPVRSVNALRTILAAPEEARVELSMQLYKAYWQDDKDVSDLDVLSAIARPFGVDAASAAADESLKARLHANCEEALSRGAFGVPSFYSLSTDALFWGQDRLGFALAAEGAHAAYSGPQHLVAGAGDGRRRTLTVYHDFASPWSYLGSTQVEAVARAAGARVEYVPILLGALFNAIGTANVPMLTLPPAKLKYQTKDMQDWATYWDVEVRFPDQFPIRSVLPLRVSIQNEATIPIMYAAAWRKNLPIADPEVLHKVLDDAGFDAKALIEGAQDPAVKDQLKANTQRAIEAGVCGVPTFQVDGGELVWGQDRWEVVHDLLRGWESATYEDATPRSKL